MWIQTNLCTPNYWSRLNSYLAHTSIHQRCRIALMKVIYNILMLFIRLMIIHPFASIGQYDTLIKFNSACIGVSNTLCVIIYGFYKKVSLYSFPELFRVQTLQNRDCLFSLWFYSTKHSDVPICFEPWELSQYKYLLIALHTMSFH